MVEFAPVPEPVEATNSALAAIGLRSGCRLDQPAAEKTGSPRDSGCRTNWVSSGTEEYAARLARRSAADSLPVFHPKLRGLTRP